MGSTLLETDLSELEEESKLLHLIFHRNKNQHRLAKWWKWLSMLRRTINDIQTGSDPQRVDAQVTFTRDVLIHKCHQAFSNVVADSQFSSLGLVLMAILARVNRIVGGQQDLHDEDTTNEPSLGMDLDLQNLEDFGEAVARDSEAVVHSGAKIIETHGDRHAAVIDKPLESDKLSTLVISQPLVSSSSSSKPKKKKKRSKTNVIDDLFSGLS